MSVNWAQIDYFLEGGLSMEYLDFSSVITTIRKYINDERTVMDKFLKEEVKIDQLHLMDQVFSSFCDDEEALDFTFDNGQVCR